MRQLHTHSSMGLDSLNNMSNLIRTISSINILISFLLLSLLLSSSSCNKEPEYIKGTLHGKVIDIMTKEPVEGARIFFRYRDKCPFEDYDPCWTVLDSTSYISDENGEFTITFSIQAEYMPSNPHRFSAKPIKDGYFNLSLDGIGAFGPGRDSLTVEIRPKAYIRVRVLDETQGQFNKYDGIRLWHNTFVPIDTVLQFPLDTTIVIDGNPVILSTGQFNSIRWNLIYLDSPEILGPLHVIPNIQCPPHDTCDVEIRF